MAEGATSLGFQNSPLLHCTVAECELQVMCMDNVATSPLSASGVLSVCFIFTMHNIHFKSYILCGCRITFPITLCKMTWKSFRFRK